MKIVSVLTATYNRKEFLAKLFESLCMQTDKDFKWVIIDDGSSDGTDSVVSDYIHKADFEIDYHKKENGGKHTALNYGYKYVNTPLTFIVDSDDYLTSDAIQNIKDVYRKFKREKDLCGFSFLRGKPTGGYLSDSGVPVDGMKESYVQCRINRGIGGDMAEVWFTECLKSYPFPEYPGEKFLGEDIVWVKMSEKYKLRFFNKVIYISDYLENGLTNNRRKHNIASPNGCVARAKVFLNSDANVKIKIKSMLQYHIYGKFSGKTVSMLLKESNKKLLYLILLIPAEILYCRWRVDI